MHSSVFFCDGVMTRSLRYPELFFRSLSLQGCHTRAELIYSWWHIMPMWNGEEQTQGKYRNTTSIINISHR